jgi:hypothetical protein
MQRDQFGESPVPSRRSVLRGAAGMGAAGIAATALAGGGQALAAPAKPAGRGSAGRGSAVQELDQIVVHVRDARTGQLDVYRGTAQVQLHDPDLAARLVLASRPATGETQVR